MKLAKTTNKTNDKGQFPIVQITFLDRPAVDAAVAEPYGIHSSPKTNSPCLLLEINGDCSNRIIIPLSAFNRTKELEETEVELGNFEVGSIIKFDKEGNVTLTLPAKKITITNGTDDLVDLIKQLCEACEAITTLTSIGAQPPMNKAAFTALKSKLGAFVA